MIFSDHWSVATETPDGALLAAVVRSVRVAVPAVDHQDDHPPDHRHMREHKRTVASALRAVGLHNERRFFRYHRVLSRAKWSTQEGSRILLGLLVEAFVPEGPLVVGVDETLERRQGRRIAAKGI
jgi:hypothetical protein